jgi:hypothetical protein
MSANIINRMIEATSLYKQTHNMSYTVASILFTGTTKQVGTIHFNENRSCCRGQICPSVHSEVNTIVSHFGKNICFSNKHGWRRRCPKREQRKQRS